MLSFTHSFIHSFVHQPNIWDGFFLHLKHISQLLQSPYFKDDVLALVLLYNSKALILLGQKMTPGLLRTPCGAPKSFSCHVWFPASIQNDKFGWALLLYTFLFLSCSWTVRCCGVETHSSCTWKYVILHMKLWFGSNLFNVTRIPTQFVEQFVTYCTLI